VPGKYNDIIMPKKYTKEQFVAAARAVHGNTYDYSQTLYVNSATPLRIECRVPGHVPFWQTPSNHCRGNGCPVCSTERRVAGVLCSAAEEFVIKARAVHGDLYGYEETVYADSKTKLAIHCPKHGRFLQSPAQHLRGLGCPSCGLDRGAGTRRDSLEDFKAKALARHGEIYDYSNVEYVNSRTKVKIGCPFHGPFFKRPAMHINGEGCPVCGLQRKGRTVQS
jgi:hypothetical protein